MFIFNVKVNGGKIFNSQFTIYLKYFLQLLLFY